jgi:hypothetical protein
MTELIDAFLGAKRVLAVSRARLIHAAWAFLMRCFREPA